MAKRGNGEGSIYQRSDGKWCGSISIGWTDDGKLKRRTIYGKTRKEVADKITMLKNDHILGRSIEPTKINVAEHFNNWLQQKKLHNRPGTWARDESHIRNHIIPYLGRIKLVTLSHSNITAFYLYLQEETELSQRTIYDIATILRAGLKDAVNKQLIYQSPAELIPKPKKGVKEARFLDQEEINRFLYAAKGERLEDLFVLMLNTGLRPGEGIREEHRVPEQRQAGRHVADDLRRRLRRPLLADDGQPPVASDRPRMAGPGPAVHEELRADHQPQAAPTG
mgnify:CR=1 FL=1